MIDRASKSRRQLCSPARELLAMDRLPNQLSQAYVTIALR